MSLTFPCIYCTDDLKCTKYTDDEAISFCVLGPCKDEKPSNGDKIRAMSDEKLAEMLTPMYSCKDCPLSMAEREPCGTDGRRCLDRVLEWVKKEADND